MSCFRVIKHIKVYLFNILILVSCSETLTETDNIEIKIINTSIDLDRFDNTLFLQLETNKTIYLEDIKKASVQITYLGEDFLDTNIFELYDDGTNGDIIPFNGTYTLLTHADTIRFPNITPEIRDIVIDNSFKLLMNASDSLDIQVTILGKSFRIDSRIIDYLDDEIISTKNINLDNSYIELKINTDYMYLDNFDTIECDRAFNNNPSEDAFESYFEWSNSIPLKTHSNYFLFSTKIPFRSVSECGGTGTAYLRFILHDLDTMSQILSEDITLIIYGCGDGICELGYEDEETCTEDCK